jgi:hypothetical protein
MNRMIVGVIAGCLMSGAARAHDALADGQEVPDWIRKACCSRADARLLRDDDVHVEGNFFRVDGYKEPIPREQAQISKDGRFWIFYRDYPDGTQSRAYCFFIPAMGS